MGVNMMVRHKQWFYTVSLWRTSGSASQTPYNDLLLSGLKMLMTCSLAFYVMLTLIVNVFCPITGQTASDDWLGILWVVYTIIISRDTDAVRFDPCF